MRARAHPGRVQHGLRRTGGAEDQVGGRDPVGQLGPGHDLGAVLGGQAVGLRVVHRGDQHALQRAQSVQQREVGRSLHTTADHERGPGAGSSEQPRGQDRRAGRAQRRDGRAVDHRQRATGVGIEQQHEGLVCGDGGVLIEHRDDLDTQRHPGAVGGHREHEACGDRDADPIGGRDLAGGQAAEALGQRVQEEVGVGEAPDLGPGEDQHGLSGGAGR